MAKRTIWMDYLTAEEKQLLETEDPKSRITRDIVKNCWSRHYKKKSDEKFDRYINRGTTGEDVRSMNKHLVNSLTVNLDLNGDSNKRAPGDYIKSDDWRAYAKPEEIDILDILGLNHPEASAIMVKCISRRTATRAKLKKLSLKQE